MKRLGILMAGSLLGVLLAYRWQPLHNHPAFKRLNHDINPRKPERRRLPKKIAHPAMSDLPDSIFNS